MWERKSEVDREKVMVERKCFVCRSFGHITYYYRNVEEEKSIPMPSNKFEVLKSRVT